MSVCSQAYSIDGTIFLPKYTLEEAQTLLVLTDFSNPDQIQTIKGYLKQDGTFNFTDLSLGKYLLEIDTPNYIIQPASVIIQIKSEPVIQEDGSSQEEIITKAYDHSLGNNPNELLNELDYPLSVNLFEKMPEKLYYENKDKGLAATGQLGVILGNPWLLGGIVVIGTIMLLQKWIEKLDPEMAEKLKNGGKEVKKDDDDYKKILETNQKPVAVTTTVKKNNKKNKKH